MIENRCGTWFFTGNEIYGILDEWDDGNPIIYGPNHLIDLGSVLPGEKLRLDCKGQGIL